VNRAVDWIAGEFPSAKAAMDFRMVRYDGMLARSFVVTMENDPAVVAYWEKPAPFRWTDGLRWRSYTPDYAVELADGRTIAVEVMPLAKVAKTQFMGRAPNIRCAAVGAGYSDFELWTEAEIESQPRLANAGLLASERSFVDDDEQLHRVRVAVRELGGRARVGELRRASRLAECSFRAVVRLVALGELRMTDDAIPLDDNAAVEVTPSERRP
jgi:hypothetical protein